MNDALKRWMDKSSEINERAASAAVNAFDWLFNKESLVKSGKTPYTVIHTGDPMSVRYYDLADEEIPLADGSLLAVNKKKLGIPLVLVPPLGVTTETFDLMPNRSLVRYMAARGFRTYLIDWGTPERRHAALSMRDYADRLMAEALQAVREHSGQQDVNLMGWCMGGLLALIHAGLPDTQGIRSIVTVASPIDMRGGGLIAGVSRIINTPAKFIAHYTDFRLNKLNPESFHAPGWVTALAFKLTDPIGSITTYWDLLVNLWDREFVESHSTTSDYLNHMLAYPIGMVGDMFTKVAMHNQMAKGEFVLERDRVSQFSRIQAPMYVFAGSKDVLVGASTAEHVLDVVGSTDKRFEVAPGGHMGVILGSSSQRAVWERAANWLEQRSDAPVAAKRRAPARKMASTVAAKAPSRRSKAAAGA
ncbi:alpha/beta fold hydrolase [Curvibacter sp. APW13]|uniref:alpha/beta fold hydrolase n=1 Tax=Curvibacter sp. APW13 TaxID=3077236 RepID=UPI0028DDE7C4|nr:alpha/beta fold hydrolase [Curvibacter sp. APW13]MDT8990230.1 alpha/beta fold hydrolase [Curvibacter sp. APW13]